MNDYTKRILLFIRKKWQRIFGVVSGNLHYETNPQRCADIIYECLVNDSPCMIGRFGNTEFQCLLNYLGVESRFKNPIKFLNGTYPALWWIESYKTNMMNYSGFFPVSEQFLSRFCKMFLEDISQLDVLGCWIQQEYKIKNLLRNSKKVFLPYLEPYWADNTWTRALAGKKVLVVHPFARLIQRQYNQHREFLFANPDVLPLFDLKIVEAVQSLGGESHGFENWFEAFDYMKAQIDSVDYDICIIGCGAYGFSLAAYVKRQGKKAIHLGGATQLMFGIKGNRWEDPQYGVREWGIPEKYYLNMFNEFWTKPDDVGRPKNADAVEGACYW